MTTLKESAVEFAVSMGYPVDTGEHNRCVNRYLAGARAALEMGASCFNGFAVHNPTQIKNTLLGLLPDDAREPERTS